MSAPLPGSVEALASGSRGPFPGSLLLTGTDEPLLENACLTLAASLLCPGADPERQCDACRRAKTFVLDADGNRSGLHPDLLWVEPAGVQIRVDQIRQALAFAAGRPYESPRRVAVVWHAELLGVEAGNALLKSLEEPGSVFHWILATARPEVLLPTIRSRCAILRVPAAPLGERIRAWRDSGRGEEEAADLALLERQRPGPTAEDLEEFRRRRGVLLEALSAAVGPSGIPAAILLAEIVGKGKPPDVSLFTELLADAAVAGAMPVDALRHRAVAGTLQRIAAAVPRASLQLAAWKAADPPPDTRRGNLRLHFESLLLELVLSRG